MKKKLLLSLVILLSTLAARWAYIDYESKRYDAPIDQQAWSAALHAFDQKQYATVRGLTTSTKHPRFKTLEGLMWEHGLGVEKDLSKAFTLYHKAAKKGDPEAMNKISRFYHDGTHVQQDKEKAWMWVQRAAEKNDYFALTEYALIFIYNDQIQDNLHYSLKNFSAAANYGSDESFKMLSILMGQFEDFPNHFVLSQFFLNLNDLVKDKRGKNLLRERYPHLFLKTFVQDEKKDPRLAIFLKELSQKTTPEQKKLAKKLAQDWRIGTGFEKEFKAMGVSTDYLN